MTEEVIIKPKFPINETIKAHLRFYYQGWYFKRLIIYLLIFLSIICYRILTRGNLDIFLILAPIALISIILYHHFSFKKRTRESLIKNPRIKENVTFTFNHKGFIEKGETFEVQHLWSEYLKIKETNEYFYLYINKRSAIILPKKYFISDINKFKQLLESTTLKTIFH